MEVGEKLKDFREKRGVSKAHVSRMTGIARSRLYMFETGRTRVPFEDLLKIVMLGLHSTMEEFFKEEFPDGGPKGLM